ncbi:hypothetical protein K4A87_14265 [Xanthomonas fragariae]|nr:hypothetical protein K4A87_14265 [Xanthomonas fragariae]
MALTAEARLMMIATFAALIIVAIALWRDWRVAMRYHSTSIHSVVTVSAIVLTYRMVRLINAKPNA